MYTKAAQHLATALTVIVALSPIAPVLAYSMDARGETRTSVCVDSLTLGSTTSAPASVSRVCPGELDVANESTAVQTTIEIRNINP